MPKTQAARTFGIGVSSVKCYAKMAQKGHSLSPKESPGKRRKLDERAMKLLEEDLHSHPACTYEQRVELLSEVVGVRVSKSTVCRAIKRMGYTRKKDRRMQTGFALKVGVGH
jgi:transposase